MRRVVRHQRSLQGHFYRSLRCAGGSEPAGAAATAVGGHAVRGPVVDALVGLGFTAKHAEEACDKVLAADPDATTSSALRAALSLLGKK